MKRIFVILGVLVILFSASATVNSVKAEGRYATCDVCGYCPDSYPTPPTKWPQCVQCLYTGLSNALPPDKATLLINEDTNLPPTPAQGHIYTVFGCIKTDLNDFTQTGAAQSLVQVLLNIIFATAGGVTILYLVYGSFLILSSQGDSERLAHGKRVIMGAIIGIVFTLSSVFIVNLLANNVIGLPGFGTVTPTPTP